MRKICFVVLTVFITSFSPAQSKIGEKLKANPLKDVRISFFKDTPIIEAINQIDSLLEKYEHKKILLAAEIRGNIGLDIEREYYRQALSKIAFNNNLDIVEGDTTISLGNKSDNPLDARQVNISAIFFEANVTQMKQRGINWDLLLSKSGLIINPSFNSGTSFNADSAGPNFKFGVKSATDLGKFSSYTNALLNFVESENLGRVLAKLSLTVRDGKEGAIQVGSDFSVKQYDFAGNVLDRFYPTGTIIKVTPHVHKEDTLYYALLNLNVEKSMFEAGTANNEIVKEAANTDVLLFNKEEAIVGGLMTGETITLRGGIPGLKDLPWWVFGLKYLFGFDQKQYVQNEVIILVKIEIIPTLRERMLEAKQNVLDKKIIEDNNDLEKYKIKPIDDKKNEE
jgi:type IV pilus assembly protein PilQ